MLTFTCRIHFFPFGKTKIIKMSNLTKQRLANTEIATLTLVPIALQKALCLGSKSILHLHRRVTYCSIHYPQKTIVQSNTSMYFHHDLSVQRYDAVYVWCLFIFRTPSTGSFWHALVCQCCVFSSIDLRKPDSAWTWHANCTKFLITKCPKNARIRATSITTIIGTVFSSILSLLEVGSYHFLDLFSQVAFPWANSSSIILTVGAGLFGSIHAIVYWPFPTVMIFGTGSHWIERGQYCY